jgi:hypothetical protein
MEAAIVEFQSGSDQIDQKIAELWAILDGDTNSPMVAATGTPATGCAPSQTY